MAWTTRTSFGVYLSALTHPMGWIGVGTVWRTRICDWVQVNISKSRSRWYRSGAFPTLSLACTRTLRSFPLRSACRKPDLPLGAQKSGYLGMGASLDPCLWSYLWGQLGFREHESRSVTSFSIKYFCIVIFLSWIATPAFGAAKPRGFASSNISAIQKTVGQKSHKKSNS